MTRISNNVRHVCDFRYASNFLRLSIFFTARSDMYAHVNARFSSLNAALPKASSNTNGIVFLTSVADINLAVKSAGRQTGLWSISTVRGWSILADHFQSHGLNSLSLSLSLSLVSHHSILSQQHRRKTVKEYQNNVRVQLWCRRWRS